jgi:actin related protein 2/3 complex, subunit 3
MPSYHSKIGDADGVSFQEAGSCAIMPIKTFVRGPAPVSAAEKDDIIDEMFAFFRANVLFRNFDVRNSADRTLIYLTLYLQQCLVKCEKISERDAAVRELYGLAQKPFAAPGEPGWPLGGIFTTPQNKTEFDLFKSYFKQAREEVGLRLVKVLYPEGGKNKWWQSFSKRKFMGKELQD